MPNKNTKKKTSLKLAAVAKNLRQIADKLEKGEFTTGAGQVKVGDPSFLKTRSELKDSTAYFSLSIKMELTETKTAKSKTKKTGKAKKPRSSGSGEAKRVKKEINRLWKSLRRQIEDEEKPDQIDSNSLLKLWEEYTIFAETEWSKAWIECKKEVEKCLRAANAEEWAEAKTAVKEIIRLTKNCHQKHK